MIINITLRFLQTKRFNLLFLLNFILIGSHCLICSSQDLYDKEHSQRYAEYLVSGHQHALAAEEFERLVYFDKTNISLKYRLVKSYRLSGDFSTGIKRIYSFYGNSPDTMPQILATEFLKLELLTDSLSVAANYIHGKNNLSLENRTIFQSCNLLLSGNYSKAGILVKEAVTGNPAFPRDIINITNKATGIKLKSPFIAAGFSALIPGTGKFYTKNWSDGLFSMIFVAGNVWQAYRGFHENGIKSGYGWVFAGLSGSFYIGNIFGAVKAAKRYNKNKKNEIDNQVFEFIRSDSF